MKARTGSIDRFRFAGTVVGVKLCGDSDRVPSVEAWAKVLDTDMNNITEARDFLLRAPV